ncbi:MAG: hypothetical protein JSS82_17640 [Bacteroidetes bacterium]|nr:hypothetical protein [Bacteroidota bacterium]
MRQTLLRAFFLLFSITNVAEAQHFRFSHYDPGSYSSVSELGRHEIRLDIGALSADQIRGISTAEQTKFDFPKTISTAVSLGYRFYPVDWMAISLTGAVDYQNGNASNYSKTYPNLTIGTYDRCSWSAALGITFIYVDDFGFQMYGGIEGGYTLYKANTYFDTAYWNNRTVVGYNLSQTSNPLHVRDTYPCWQVTALGLKSNGPFSVFFELGYGYRGMIVLGVAGRL